MASLITFGDIDVPSYNVESIKITGPQAAPYHWEVSIRCRTADIADYQALQNLQGPISTVRLASGYTRVIAFGAATAKTLIINGTAYDNCYIQSISVLEPDGAILDYWEFTISFVMNAYLNAGG